MLKCQTNSLNQNSLWDDLILTSNTATFFQQQRWLEIWVKHFPVDYEIVGIFDKGNLAGIAPLSFDRENVYILGTTPVLGKELVNDFGDIVCEPDREKEIWYSVIKYLSETRPRKKFRINFLRANSPSFEILKTLTDDISQINVSPFINLPETTAEYLSGLERKDRHELKRKLRRLENNNYSFYGADLSETNLRQFFGLMKLSSPEKESFLSKPMELYFSDVFRQMNQDQIVLFFLDIDGEKAAGKLAFRFKNEILLYNSGMNPEYKHLSAGLLTDALLIEKSINLGYKRFDFLSGNEDYKYNLGATDNKIHQLTIKL